MPIRRLPLRAVLRHREIVMLVTVAAIVVSASCGLGPISTERSAVGVYDLVAYFDGVKSKPLPFVAADTNFVKSSAGVCSDGLIRIDTLYAGTLTVDGDYRFTETWTFFGQAETSCSSNAATVFDERKKRTLVRAIGSWEISGNNTLKFLPPGLLGTSTPVGTSVADVSFVPGQRLTYEAAVYQRR
jgi:hypothetical protein